MTDSEIITAERKGIKVFPRSVTDDDRRLAEELRAVRTNRLP